MRPRADSVARALGVALFVTTVAALIWAFAFNDVGPAPDYALGSELVYRLEQAIAAILLLAIPMIVIGQLLAGRLPKGLGKDGVEWDA
jgi:hypothetical protein